LKKGLQQTELAKILGVSKVTINRYEKNVSRPNEVILRRFKEKFKFAELPEYKKRE